MPIVEAPSASRYELESQLGGTRSGEVWRARDTPDRARPSPTSWSRTRRCRRQRRSSARSASSSSCSAPQNKHLAGVLDFGKDGQGRLFVATRARARDSRSIASWRRRVRCTLDRAKAIVAQIGEALLEGQKVGVVHHDLVAEERARRRRRRGQGDQLRRARVAVSDTVFGVPEYLSPEQAEGKLVDQRSNTYSLGAIMTLMLTGQPPVRAATYGDRAAAGARGASWRRRAASPPGLDARDRPRRPEGDGQEPEPPSAHHAPVPDRGQRARGPRRASLEAIGASGSRRR